MMVVLVGMLALDTWFFFTTSDLLLFNNKVNIYMVAGLLVFMFASSFFHELGHASACKYFGVRHGGIGFGLYLNFPVLYTDVTEVWKLNRAQRCVVNLAGVYFQSYWLIALLVAFLITGNDILRYLILIMNLGFVMTLNPSSSSTVTGLLRTCWECLTSGSVRWSCSVTCTGLSAGSR